MLSAYAICKAFWRIFSTTKEINDTLATNALLFFPRLGESYLYASTCIPIGHFANCAYKSWVSNVMEILLRNQSIRSICLLATTHIDHLERKKDAVMDGMSWILPPLLRVVGVPVTLLSLVKAGADVLMKVSAK